MTSLSLSPEATARARTLFWRSFWETWADEFGMARMQAVYAHLKGPTWQGPPCPAQVAHLVDSIEVAHAAA